MKAWRALGTICFAALVAAALVLFAAAVAVAIVSAPPANAAPVHAAKADELKQVRPFFVSRPACVLEPNEWRNAPLGEAEETGDR